jgi:hypothetical protein
MTPLHKRYAPLAIGFAAYLAILGALAYRAGNVEFGLYAALEVGLALVVLAIDLRCRLPMGVLWGLFAWGLLHMMGGTIKVGGEVLYHFRFWTDGLKYDQLIHAYGFAVATLVCWSGFRKATGYDKPVTFGVASMLVLMGVGLGALNEVVEFVMTLTLPSTNVGGYVNTGWDLVSNLTGAVIAAICVALYTNRGPKEPARVVRPAR